MSFLNKPTNPALPLPTPDYSRQYHDAHNNVLRLFFNQLQNIFDKVLGRNGGQFIDCPNGVFFNTTDQAFTANDTAEPIEFDNTYLNNAVRLWDPITDAVSTTQVQAQVSGVYNFQYTGQLLSSSGNSKSVSLWISRYDAAPTKAGSFVTGFRYEIITVGTTNFTLIGAAANTVGTVFVATGPGTGTGTAWAYPDVKYSTRINTIKDNGHYVEMTWNFNIDLAAGEAVELYMSVDDHYTEVELAAPPATAPYPAGASSVLSVNFIAPLPEPRPTLPP